jgi:hypothetical protein
MANRVMPLVAPLLSYDASIQAEASEAMGSSVSEYSKAYRWVINGIPTTLKVVFKYNNAGKIVEVEGVLPARVEEVGVYKLIPVSNIPWLLSERVSGKINSSEWYISKLGLTGLTITSVRSWRA